MPPKQPSKADLAKKQKIVEDKTFGLKNKNKSKNVQKYVQTLKQSVQPKPDPTKIAVKVRFLQFPQFILFFPNWSILLKNTTLKFNILTFQLTEKERGR